MDKGMQMQTGARWRGFAADLMPGLTMAAMVVPIPRAPSSARCPPAAARPRPLLIARPEGRVYFGNAANVGGKLAALDKASRE